VGWLIRTCLLRDSPPSPVPLTLARRSVARASFILFIAVFGLSLQPDEAVVDGFVGRACANRLAADRCDEGDHQQPVEPGGAA
jgi:hypothetical protein